MINCSFLPVFYEYHRCLKAGQPLPAYKDFGDIENVWMGFYGLGKFETYQFMYGQCTGIAHLQQWLIGLKGEQYIQEATTAFDRWTKEKTIDAEPPHTNSTLLNEAQWQHWKEQGYIKVSNLVAGQLCDAVVQLMCSHLGVDMLRPETWYSSHPDWHGLMLQLYQHESINAIKTLPALRQLFTELYGTTNIIANTEKVSFNPPETATWKFRHNKLHWDIDFKNPDVYYIQALVYLNDVPANRGPLHVVPGFHHRFKDWMKTYPDPHQAQVVMQDALTGTPVPGKKGDIVCWLQTLPHAASANHSNLPRFVQYTSFTKL